MPDGTTFDTGTSGKGDSGKGDGSSAGATFTVGGTVSGLSGKGLTLANGGQTLAVAADGTFTFKNPVASGALYAVTVGTQPSDPSQTCTVTSGTGKATSNVTNIAVKCATTQFTIGGTVVGLTGTGLVLQDNNADNLAVTANGAFTFKTPVASGSAFSVTVQTQPDGPAQSCVVTGGTGVVGSGNVTGVMVNCATDTFTVGGQISGLAGGSVVLQNNAGDNLTVNANGSFAFPTPLSSGAAYEVTVLTQPSSPTQTCTVTTGTDSGTVADANVTSVRVTCTTNTYTIGGTITGLTGTGLVLQDNAGDNLSVAADGTFTFATPVASGATYAVTVLTQPTGPIQTCTFTTGTDTGTVAAANVTSVAITCATNAFTVGGTVTGLSGTGLVLQDNGGDSLTVTADGTFTFATPIASGSTYAVTVSGQPTGPSQNCVVTGGTGTVSAGAVTSVTVNCTTDTFTVGGTVSGLVGMGLVLQDNAGDNLSVTANGTFAFATPVASGAAYAVTVLTQPGTPTQSCVVAEGAGTVGAGNVTGVTVTCTTNKYTIGGTVSGLVGTGLVLQDNGGDNLTVAANGAFTFATKVASGATFVVTASTEPAGPTQTCTVTNGTGVVLAANVTDVAIACTTNTYAVGGTVSGLAGTGLTLQDNAGSNLAITTNGTFSFATKVASGATYAVTVLQNPSLPTQSCVVTNGSGTVTNAAITTVVVTCTTSKYTVGGTVAGLSTGDTVVLQDNGGDNLTVKANGTFTFLTSVASGTTYAVTVLTQPGAPSESCLVTGGTGTVVAGNVTSVMVNCTVNKFTVGGTVSGLAGTGLVLQDNGGDNLTINANGTFAFATAIASGGTYAVTTLTNPSTPSQTCAVTNGSGSVTNANITSVVVTCVTNTYTIGGTVSGLAAGDSVVLQDDLASNLTVSANGAFTFGTSLPSGGTYAVTVLTNPANPSESCVVTSGTGTVTNANVTSVVVTCTSTVCSPQTVSNCVLTQTNSGSTDTGTCAAGDVGSCSYSCTNGTFTQVTNTCALPQCSMINGTTWCQDTVAGRSCDTLCTSLGFGNPTISATNWFNAQDTQPLCTQIGAAFGLTFGSISSYTYACAEAASGQILCSSYSGCPANHLTTSDGAPFTAICPCD